MKKPSFFSYLVDKGMISLNGLEYVTTTGQGNDAYIKVKYKSGKTRKLKPFALAREYLKEILDVCVEHLNFNNAHWDRIGCSCINAWNLNKDEYDKYISCDFVNYKDFHNGYGNIEFCIFSEEEMIKSYNSTLGM